MSDPMLEELGRVLASKDPIPPRVAAAAAELFTWRTVDDELAGLVRAAAERADEPAAACRRTRRRRIRCTLEVGRPSAALVHALGGTRLV